MHCDLCPPFFIHIFPVTFSKLTEAATFFPFTHTLKPFPFLYFAPVLSQIMVMILPWYNTLSKQNHSHLSFGSKGFTSIVSSARGLKPTNPVMIRSLKVEWL